jgi:hypothetical protein
MGARNSYIEITEIWKYVSKRYIISQNSTLYSYPSIKNNSSLNDLTTPHNLQTLRPLLHPVRPTHHTPQLQLPRCNILHDLRKMPHATETRQNRDFSLPNKEWGPRNLDALIVHAVDDKFAAFAHEAEGGFKDGWGAGGFDDDVKAVRVS